MRLALLLGAVAAIDINAPDPNGVSVKCTTTKGDFTLMINPSWGPIGAARFLEMVDTGFFDRIAAYRVVPGFLAQFGIPYTNTKKWPDIRDDPNIGVQYPLFKRGMIAFAGYAPNTRGTEAFIGYQDTANLGRSAWGNPFGIVTSGMDVIDRFYSGYGDLTQFGGHAPDPTRMANEGGAFLKTEYPMLDYITSCSRASGGANSRLATGGAGPRTSLPAPALATAEPLPSCTASFCGSGIGFDGTAKCLCHENCLLPSSPTPCCPGFQAACPAQYALGSPVRTIAAPAKGKKAKKIKKGVTG